MVNARSMVILKNCSQFHNINKPGLFKWQYLVFKCMLTEILTEILVLHIQEHMLHLAFGVAKFNLIHKHNQNQSNLFNPQSNPLYFSDWINVVNQEPIQKGQVMVIGLVLVLKLPIFILFLAFESRNYWTGLIFYQPFPIVPILLWCCIAWACTVFFFSFFFYIFALVIARSRFYI